MDKLSEFQSWMDISSPKIVCSWDTPWIIMLFVNDFESLFWGVSSYT